MNAPAKLAFAAAAVVVVAVAGSTALPRDDVPRVGGTPVSPTPIATASPTMSPLAGAACPPAGELAIGRHSFTVEGLSFSLETPTAGWVSDGAAWITRDTGVTPDGPAILFWSPDNVFADPCAHTPLNPPVGPSVADLATAVGRIPGTDDVTHARDIAAIFGADADYRQIIVGEDVGCAAEDQGEGDDCAGSVVCPRYATQLGSRIRLWIVVRDGSRLVIEAESYKGAGEEIGTLIGQVVDSIEFD